MKHTFLTIGLLSFASVSLLSAQPAILSVTDPYTQGSKLAPGGQALLSGAGLGNGDPSRTITINGKTAFVLSTTGTGQVIVQIPVDAGVGSALPVVVSNAGGTSASFPITLSTYAPVLINSQSGAIISPRHANGTAITPTSPAVDGETIAFSVIGLGPTNPAQVTGVAATGQPTATPVLVNVGSTGVPSGITALAASGQVALYTVTFTVPQGIVNGSYQTGIIISGVASNQVAMTVGGAATGPGPSIISVKDLAGGAALCPGGQAIIAGTGLGSNPNVTVGGKTAFNLVPPSSTNGASMTIEIPVDAPLGTANVVITLGTGASNAPFPIALVKYAPVLPSNGPGSNLAQAYHAAAQTPVTAAAPAAPNEQIGLIAIGLGPTQPQVATGISPSNQSSVTTTLPTVTLGGKAATGVSAFAFPNQVATYLVLFTMPAGASSGNVPVTVTIGAATSNTLNIPVSTAPYVSYVTNAASSIAPPLPNSGIAQGAIFTVFGGLLGPDSIAIAPAAFQSTSLSGTSISVSVAGSTVSPLLYYTSAGQVAALLPSNTPTGPGAITVTYNGQTGQPAPITVVQNNLGIFTVTSDGTGAGIVTYPDYSLVSATKAANCGGPSTTCGAANPGDTLILWATGLGPVSGGTDASGAGLGVNQANVPLTVWLGGVQANVLYQGRSGCCIGEDQIVFTVPNNVPTGCAVPLVIQINSQISNSVVMPVAIGSRTCSPASGNLTSDAVQQLSGNAPTTIASISLDRQDNYPNGLQDYAKILLARLTVAPALQPFIVSYIDTPPLGTCLVSTSLKSASPPFATVSAVDAGTQLTVSGPNGNQNVSLSSGGGDSKAVISSNGSYLALGAYTVSGSGGADIGKFTTSITIPTPPTLTSPQPDTNSQTAVTRSNGLAVNWTGGTSGSLISLTGQSATDNTFNAGAAFTCSLATSQGSFIVPAYVLLALPAGVYGSLDFHPTAIPVTFSATGLNLGFLSAQRDFFAGLAFK